MEDERVPALVIETGHEGDDYIVRLRGEFDLNGRATVERALDQAANTDAARILVDVNGLDFIDSTGLRVFVKAVRSDAVDGRRLRFTRGNGHVAELFRLTALDLSLPFI